MPVDKKISALPAVVTPAGTDTLEVVQGGVSKKETVTQILAAEVTARTNGDNTNIASLATKAAINSQAFTGTPSLPTGTTAITQAPGDSSTKLATTAFVTTADNLKLNLTGGTMSGAIAMGTSKITGLGNGTTGTQDAATVIQMEAADLYKASRLKTYDPTATSAFPVTGIAGGAIVIGDRYYISVAGTMNGGAVIVAAGDIIEARVNAATNNAADWSVQRQGILQETNTSFVSKNGSDTTGVAGRMDKPFLTIGAATTATSSGGTVVVYPGTYSESGLGKAGVNFELLNGVIISSAAANMWTGANISYSISGDGEFTSTSGSIVSLTGTSTVSIRGKKASATTGIMFVGDNTSQITANFTESIINTGNGINAQTIAVGVIIRITCSVLQTAGQITSGIGRIDIRAHQITSSNFLFDTAGSGNIYGDITYTGTVLALGSTVQLTQDVVLNIYGDITTTNTISAFYQHNTAAATGFFTYLNFYGKLVLKGRIISQHPDDKITLHGEVTHNVANQPCILFNANTGTVRVRSRLKNLDAGVTSYAIDTVGFTGTVILENAILVTGAGGAPCINAAGARNVLVLGTAMTNTAKDVDVTITGGTLITDVNVI